MHDRRTYDHTILSLRPDGSIMSACVGLVEDGMILRTNAMQCTGLEGTVEYDAHFAAYRSFADQTTLAVIKGTATYMLFLTGEIKTIDEANGKVAA